MDKKMQKVIATRDDSSHWYVIPSYLYDEFSKLYQKACDDDYEAQKEFDEKFGKYATGGGLNNVQLWAEV
jgi:hypothetical protein